MFEISLSDFVDFTLKTGSAKLTKVRQLRRRGEYTPIQDFWRDLREAIVFHHETGNVDRDSLDFVFLDLRRRKVPRYRRALQGYKRFLGRKTVRWFQPPEDTWRVGDMTVRVNPELGLTINGEPHVIKLYFKEDNLSKRRIDTALLLMEEVLRDHCVAGVKFSILDVERGRLFTSNSHSADVRPFMIGEAWSLQTMWLELDRGAPGDGPRLVSPDAPGAGVAPAPVVPINPTARPAPQLNLALWEPDWPDEAA